MGAPPMGAPLAPASLGVPPGMSPGGFGREVAPVAEPAEHGRDLNAPAMPSIPAARPPLDPAPIAASPKAPMQAVAPAAPSMSMAPPAPASQSFESAVEDGENTIVVLDGHGVMSVARSGPVTVMGTSVQNPAAVGDAIDRVLRAHGIERGGRPTVSGVLRDGASVRAIFPPMVSGPTLVVHRAPARAPLLADLAARGVLNANAVALLTDALAARRNIVVAGARGSGRSTLVMALLGALPNGDRVVVVEDRTELGRVRRDATAFRAEGDWAQAVEAALLLRGQRTVFGDCPDAVARALVANLATGSEGFLVAVEAPVSGAALQRIAAQGTQGAWLDRDAAMARLVATRPLVIETARLGDGHCRVTSIAELRASDGGLKYDAYFTLRIDGADAQGVLETQLVATGASPNF